MKNNLRVINMIKRESGLTLVFYDKNLFKVKMLSFSNLSFEELVRLNNFDQNFSIKAGHGGMAFVDSIPKALKADSVDLWFFREDGKRRLNRNEIIDLHIANEIVGNPILQLALNQLDHDFAKDFPNTAFWGTEKGFFHSTIHFSNTTSIEGRNFDFRNCAYSWGSQAGDWFCGVDKHFAPKVFEFYKK